MSIHKDAINTLNTFKQHIYDLKQNSQLRSMLTIIYCTFNMPCELSEHKFEAIFRIINVKEANVYKTLWVIYGHLFLCHMILQYRTLVRTHGNTIQRKLYRTRCTLEYKKKCNQRNMYRDQISLNIHMSAILKSWTLLAKQNVTWYSGKQNICWCSSHMVLQKTLTQHYVSSGYFTHH